MFKKLNNKGFTLIELLTVIAIIGLLATLSMISLSVARTRAKVSTTQHAIDQIFKAITLMQNDTGEWPGHQVMNQSCISLPGGCPVDNEICGPDTSAVPNTCTNGLGDGLAGLLADDAITPYTNWTGPYLKVELLKDAWNNDYFFDTDYQVDLEDKPCGCGGAGCHDVAVIGSYGPDGVGSLVDPLLADAYSCDDIILIIGR